MRKLIGIILVIAGLILTAGSFSSVETYGIVAPITMALIVAAGLAVIFWEKVKSWFGSKSS